VSRAHESAAAWLRGLRERHGSRTLVVLALIVLLGFGLRAHSALNPLESPGDDAHAYFSLSKSLYEDGTYGGPSFHDASDWSPGAPLLYAGVYYVTGGVRDNAARLVLALLGAATCVIAYLLGRRLAGTGAGLLAAAAVAIYPSFIHSNGALLSEPPAIFTLPAAVLAFLWARERKGSWAWLAPGALFGATTLIRPEYLVVGIAFVVAALLTPERRTDIRRGVTAGAIFLAGFLIPIVPWTVHNLVSLDRFVPVSTGAGKALYVGTNLSADGDYQRVKAELVRRFYGPVRARQAEQPGELSLDNINPTPLFDRIAFRHGYPATNRDAALGKAGKDQLRDDLQHHTAAYVAMLARKTGRMWDQGVGPTMTSTLGRLAQRILVLLGIAGLIVLGGRRRWWELASFAIPIGLVTLIGAVSLASTRRNEVLMSLVIPLAAAALAWGWQYARERRSGTPAGA
jgi:4-amino-4-deoxy-L-arabinose transferase-like glycosyltransferase